MSDILKPEEVTAALATARFLIEGKDKELEELRARLREAESNASAARNSRAMLNNLLRETRVYADRSRRERDHLAAVLKETQEAYYELQANPKSSWWTRVGR